MLKYDHELIWNPARLGGANGGTVLFSLARP